MNRRLRLPKERAAPKSKFAFYRNAGESKAYGTYFVMLRASNIHLGYVSKLRSGKWQANTDRLNFYAGYDTRVEAAEALNLHRIGEKALDDQKFAEIVQGEKSFLAVDVEPLALRRDSLFQTGYFKLAGGKESRFKIECDSLTDEDWMTISLMILDIVPKFGAVEGVPTGGEKLAKLLSVHKVKHHPKILIVDDVWTSGKSMIQYIQKHHEARSDYIIGAVVFARGPVPWWVTPLCRINLPG